MIKPIILMSLMTIGWVLMYFVIKAYYRSNNIRFPYDKWYLSYKKDVTLREKANTTIIYYAYLN